MSYDEWKCASPYDRPHVVAAEREYERAEDEAAKALRHIEAAVESAGNTVRIDEADWLVEGTRLGENRLVGLLRFDVPPDDAELTIADALERIAQELRRQLRGCGK